MSVGKRIGKIPDSVFIEYRESQKHANWKTTRGLLTDISERMKGHSIKPNMRKISFMLIDIFFNLLKPLTEAHMHI